VKNDSAEDFNNLLSWLDPDRERAGEKYETIRQQLIKMFTWKRAWDPEGLADETISRVTRRVGEIRTSYVGDPSLYFYAVARNVFREELRRSSRHQPDPEAELIASEINSDESREQLYDCLDKCIGKLSAANRELLITYYEGSKQGRIKSSQVLAAQFGLQPSALRMRVLRIRKMLENCIEICMESDISRENA
jgi:RNA polymerase sigma factor (sigma-70 family)